MSAIAFRVLLRWLAAAACVVAGAVPVQAAQDVKVRDGDTTIVRISARDQTRLKAAAGRIVEVIGDVVDADRNPSGRVMVLKDEAEGEVYIQPVVRAAAPGQPMAPIKLDVKTDRGTAGLLLQPADTIGETVVLHVIGAQPKAEVGVRARASSHERTLKALTLALLNPELSPELAAQFAPEHREVALWQEVRFILQGRIETPAANAERYELTNTSSAPLVLDERELFVRGVQAVAIARLSLAPGQTTTVAVVREAANGR